MAIVSRFEGEGKNGRTPLQAAPGNDFVPAFGMVRNIMRRRTAGPVLCPKVHAGSGERHSFQLMLNLTSNAKRRPLCVARLFMHVKLQVSAPTMLSGLARRRDGPHRDASSSYRRMLKMRCPRIRIDIPNAFLRCCRSARRRIFRNTCGGFFRFLNICRYA